MNCLLGQVSSHGFSIVTLLIHVPQCDLLCSTVCDVVMSRFSGGCQCCQHMCACVCILLIQIVCGIIHWLPTHLVSGTACCCVVWFVSVRPLQATALSRKAFLGKDGGEKQLGGNNGHL
jgi:hypothetical protein